MAGPSGIRWLCCGLLGPLTFLGVQRREQRRHRVPAALGLLLVLVALLAGGPATAAAASTAADGSHGEVHGVVDAEGEAPLHGPTASSTLRVSRVRPVPAASTSVGESPVGEAARRSPPTEGERPGGPEPSDGPPLRRGPPTGV